MTVDTKAILSGENTKILINALIDFQTSVMVYPICSSILQDIQLWISGKTNKFQYSSKSIVCVAPTLPPFFSL